MSTCSRPGCTKSLKSNNVKGMCSSGCLSPDAPASVRAKSSPPTNPFSLEAGFTYTASSKSPAAELRAAAGPVARFRMVAEALGLDPEAILNEFAQAWLDELKAKVE